MSIHTLTHAATLKGYLLATKAPKHMVDLAQHIIDSASSGLERVSNEDAQVPLPVISNKVKINYDASDLAASIAKLSANAPSHDDSRFAAPETPQAEANPPPLAAEDAEEDKNAPVRTGAGVMAHDYFVCPKTGRTFIKLSLADLPIILEELEDKTFDEVGILHNVSSGTLKAFLEANDIDYKQFNKLSGKQGRDYARNLARKAGKKRYDGKPCVSCGATEKFTSSGACTKCTGERTAVWRDKPIQTKPPTVLPPSDEDEALEDEEQPSASVSESDAVLREIEEAAWAEAEEAAISTPDRKEARKWEAIGGVNYRPEVIGEWPNHMDFTPDNIQARD